MAYKKDVDDCRESPGFELVDLLQKKGALVSYNDPHIPELPATRRHPHLRVRVMHQLPEPQNELPVPAARHLRHRGQPHLRRLVLQLEQEPQISQVEDWIRVVERSGAATRIWDFCSWECVGTAVANALIGW